MNDRELTKELENNKIIALMQKDIEDLKVVSERIETKLDDFINCADKKYAKRWVENAWIFLITSGGVAIISMITYAIYHAYTSL
jgi:hypothetical protein